MSITATATVEDGNIPPRVKVDILNTPTLVTSVTVTRLDADGNTRVVRTADGNELTLTVSGANKIGTLYDYEVPYGTEVQYGTVEGGLTSALVTVPADQAWLTHIGSPGLSQPIRFRPGSLQEETFPVAQGVFVPLGRTNPVVITDGVRKGAQSSMTVLTETGPQLAAMKALLADASVLLLNVPDTLGYDFATVYVAISEARVRRLTDKLVGSTLRDVVLPFIVVDQPGGGAQADRTWADVLSENATWSAVVTNHATWADVLTPTT